MGESQTRAYKHNSPSKALGWSPRHVTSRLLRAGSRLNDAHDLVSFPFSTPSYHPAPSKMASDGDTLKGINGELDENEALEAALAMSLTSSVAQAEPSSTFGSLKLDRKRMEEERLARQKKRSADQAGLAQSPAFKRPALATPQRSPGVPKHQSNQGGPTKQHSPDERSDNPLPFAKGVVKRTWVFGCPRSGDDIKLEEIFDRNHLELAVLSSFQWDESWMLSKVDIARTRLILVAFANDEAQVCVLPIGPATVTSSSK